MAMLGRRITRFDRGHRVVVDEVVFRDNLHFMTRFVERDVRPLKPGVEYADPNTRPGESLVVQFNEIHLGQLAGGLTVKCRSTLRRLR